jgi:hypothetical protein
MKSTLLETMEMAIGAGLSENSSSLRALLGLDFRVQACVHCFYVLAIPSAREEVCCLATDNGLARFSAAAFVDVPGGHRGQ